ncbi:MAG: molecular chaperone DnaJ [Gammaproteobacteria bacterium]|nr:molecular chaperone DnaJ [Gammaproteobacteria bacterium]
MTVKLAPGFIGLMIPLFAALIAGIIRLLPALIRYAPILYRIWFSWKQQTTSNGGVRTVETKFLRLHINLNGIPVEGEVIAGQFTGRQLLSLTRSELDQLIRECSGDQQSRVILQQLRASGNYSQSGYYQHSQSRQKTSSCGRMSKSQALKILGLNPGSTRQDIISAHRKLMQKAHPDHGGTAELAAQINSARDVLLKS